MFLKLTTIILVFLWFFNLSVGYFVFAQEDDLATLKQQREELQQRIDSIQDELKIVRSEKKTLERELNILNLEIKELNLAIQETNFTIREMNIAITEKEAKIEDIGNSIESQREILRELIREINDFDQVSLVEIILGYDNLSDFFENVSAIESTEKSLFGSLQEIKNLKDSLADEIEMLEQELSDRYRLKKLQNMDYENLSDKKQEKGVLVQSKESDEAVLQLRLNEVKEALYEIQRYFSGLVLEGMKVSIDDIVSFAKEASLRTGVRPAFLLAVLETESKMGENVGKGNWQTDMPKSQQEAFLQITEKLGLNPDDVPVSKKVYSGGRRVMWGGAMGPAQFMPKTWLGYEAEVAELTGSNPANPWSMRDALHAMALYLARRGASDPAKEKAASRAYISGKPTCRTWVCNTYANKIQARAIRWEEYLENK